MRRQAPQPPGGKKEDGAGKDGPDEAELGPDLNRGIVWVADSEQGPAAFAYRCGNRGLRHRRADAEAGAEERIDPDRGAEAAPDRDAVAAVAAGETGMDGVRNQALPENAVPRRDRDHDEK